ncbi:MAG TPA: hypothetical protein VI565_07850 [Burkholderiales bacterium]|nr:hypothetical protein [Burkholderiales bacterium]
MSNRIHVSLAAQSPVQTRVQDVARHITSARSQIARDAAAIPASTDIELAPNTWDHRIRTRPQWQRSLWVLVAALWVSVTLITSAAIVATTFFL